jgi:hypothetical protein
MQWIPIAGKPRKCRLLGKDELRKAGDVQADGRLVLSGLGKPAGEGVYRPVTPVRKR